VPQLHIHVIGRVPGDACWPLPVWGHLNRTRAYSSEEMESLRDALTRSVGLSACA
jgi:diadenosine tetraphosphate (Ap4A) HIT family hydrolase